MTDYIGGVLRVSCSWSPIEKLWKIVNWKTDTKTRVHWIDMNELRQREFSKGWVSLWIFEWVGAFSPFWILKVVGPPLILEGVGAPLNFRMSGRPFALLNLQVVGPLEF